MRQREIDEISREFLEAWKEFFGTELHLHRYNKEESEIDDLYGESTTKVYDKKPIKFYGIIKELPREDITSPIGKEIYKLYEITAITKELSDKGITVVNTDDLIIYKDKFGKERRLHIYDDFQKVQFVNDKIFTKIRVRYTA